MTELLTVLASLGASRFPGYEYLSTFSQILVVFAGLAFVNQILLHVPSLQRLGLIAVDAKLQLGR